VSNIKWVHISFASRSLPPYIALTIGTISRDGVKINVSCYMKKLDFWPRPPVEKWFPSSCDVTDKPAVWSSGSRVVSAAAICEWRTHDNASSTRPDSTADYITKVHVRKADTRKISLLWHIHLTHISNVFFAQRPTCQRVSEKKHRFTIKQKWPRLLLWSKFWNWLIAV